MADLQDPLIPASSDEQLTMLHERAIAALAYAGPFAMVPFYLKTDSKFCRFHGRQGMLLFLLFFALMPLWTLNLAADVLILAQFFFFILMGYAALSGRWAKLPFFYPLALKLENLIILRTEAEEKAMPHYQPGEQEPRQTEAPVPEAPQAPAAENPIPPHS